MEPDIKHDDNPGFIKQSVILPADDFDEDDEEDERIAANERKQKMHVERGNFFGI